MVGASRLSSWQENLWRPVEGASLALVRLAFGLTMLFWSLAYLIHDKISRDYLEPEFFFHYVGFEFVQPLPGQGMYWLFLMICLLACHITLGVMYRWSAILFALAWWYLFLIDKTTYLNHYYFIGLMSLLLAIVPAGRSFSLANTSTSFAPVWSVWLIRFQVGVVYFYGGVAKLGADWLRGFPAREMLESSGGHPFFGPFAEEEWAVQVLVWGGLLFDLLIVPLLLWRPTRLPAFLLAVGFHVSNALMFPIGIFPWLMIAVTTIFFEPDWPRKVLRIFEFDLPAPTREPADRAVPTAWKRKLLVSFLLLWIPLQLFVPLRHFLYPGDVNWNERGHYFAWHMMLRSKLSLLRFHVYDSATGQWKVYPHRQQLTANQLDHLHRDPRMVREFAKYIEQEYRRNGTGDVAVHVFHLCSLNGRKPELLIDPQADLTSREAGKSWDWILPQTEPLPETCWSVPVEYWETEVMQDPLLE